MRRFRASGGAVWESKVGYSRVVRAGAHVYVTGTTSFVVGGEPVRGDAYAQAKQILANLEAALARVGATLDDAVRTRIFVTDIANDWQAIGRAHAEAFGEVRPATTMVEVSALIEPWMKLEIELDACVGVEPPIDSGASLRFGTATEMKPIVEAVGLKPSKPRTVLIAEVDGVPVGCVGWTADNHAVLESLAVLDAHRNAGIATLLLDTALLRIGMETWLLTDDAYGFFERFGFESVPRPEWLDVPAHCVDAIAMRYAGA